MQDPKRLLFIAHTPSENTQNMAKAVLKGASNPELGHIDVRCKAPLETQPADIIAAQALIIGTTENLGYMAGLTKDLFDRCYYPCLEKTQGLPIAFYVRAGHDGTGTQRAIQSIATGLRWRLIQAPLICHGEYDTLFLKQCEELGLSVAASLDAGII